jgi:hypothetical protein
MYQVFQCRDVKKLRQLTNFLSSIPDTKPSTPSTFLNDNKAPLNKMIFTQKHLNHSTTSLSSQELQEVRDMSRNLRQLKRQMYLKQVETPSPVDSFLSLLMNLAVAEDAKEAFRSRPISLSSDETLSRASSLDNSFISNKDSFSSIGDLHRVEE